VTVEIMGRSFSLRGSMPEESLQKVAQLVHERLQELSLGFPATPLTDLAILVALNLAYECLETKEDYQQLQAEIEQRSKQLMQKLERHES
jgi:cell division protein ZapA (FtsZ GTPase activity inhibitor)